MSQKLLLHIMMVLVSLTACNPSVSNDSALTATAYQATQTFLCCTATPAPVVSSTPATPVMIAEKTINSQSGTAYSLAFHPDGQSIAVASGFEISIVSADLQETYVVFTPPNIGLLSVTWSPDGQQLASVEGFRHPIIHIWKWDSAQKKFEMETQLDGNSDQYGVSWSPDGGTLATLADDSKSTIQLWDTSTWEEGRILDLPYQNPRRALDWNRDSTRLFDAGEKDGEVVIFSVDIQGGNATELMQLPKEEIEVFAISPDSSKIALADKNGRIRILDLDNSTELSTFQATSEPVDIDWSPDGGQLAVLSYHTTLQLWDI